METVLVDSGVTDIANELIKDSANVKLVNEFEKLRTNYLIGGRSREISKARAVRMCKRICANRGRGHVIFTMRAR